VDNAVRTKNGVPLDDDLSTVNLRSKGCRDHGVSQPTAQVVVGRTDDSATRRKTCEILEDALGFLSPNDTTQRRNVDVIADLQAGSDATEVVDRYVIPNPDQLRIPYGHRTGDADVLATV
jgi:hypothetical protein